MDREELRPSHEALFVTGMITPGMTTASVPTDVSSARGHEVFRRRRRAVVAFFAESSRPREMDSAYVNASAARIKTMESDAIIKTRIDAILPLLNELQIRVYLAAESQSIGWGGKSKIAKLSGVSRSTITKGEKEVDVSKEILSKNRIRKMGGGRKKVTQHKPQLLQVIKELVSAHTMGNPMNPLIWTSKSIRKITAELLALNYKICHEVVRQCLIELGFSLQSNKKTDEGSNHEDRNEQFEYINATAISFMDENCPVISVDCKKKELIGNYKNNGTEWTVKKEPLEVKVYDFVDKDLGKAVPYGIYDMAKNEGFVNVGISSDTAEFAVNSIITWWKEIGKELSKP
jgi:transposase